MNRDPHNDPRFDELAAQEAEALEGVGAVAPSREALENTRLAIRVELGMAWLKGVAKDPVPSTESLQAVRRTIQIETGIEPPNSFGGILHSEPGDATPAPPVLPIRPAKRRLRVWIPSSIAACLVIGVGSLFLNKDGSDLQSVPPVEDAIIAATLDSEFQSDWVQLANLESSFDEVERDFRGFSGMRPRRGVPHDFDRRINELSDELMRLEDMT